MRIGYILWPMSSFHRKKWGIFCSRANRRQTADIEVRTKNL
jgi:hypothetical protein